jgi:hypothetical protein
VVCCGGECDHRASVPMAAQSCLSERACSARSWRRITSNLFYGLCRAEILTPTAQLHPPSPLVVFSDPASHYISSSSAVHWDRPRISAFPFLEAPAQRLVQFLFSVGLYSSCLACYIYCVPSHTRAYLSLLLPRALGVVPCR